MEDEETAGTALVLLSTTRGSTWWDWQLGDTFETLLILCRAVHHHCPFERHISQPDAAGRPRSLGQLSGAATTELHDTVYWDPSDNYHEPPSRSTLSCQPRSRRCRTLSSVSTVH